MNKKRYMKAAPVNASSYSADSTISQADAVQFIAPRIGINNRNARDKVRKRIRYSTEKTPALTKVGNKGFIFGDLMGWARKEWPGKFDDVGANMRISPLTGQLHTQGHAPDVLELPATVPKCHEVIKDLGARVSALTEEVNVLRPDAMMYRERRRKNSSSGRKGGRPRSRQM